MELDKEIRERVGRYADTYYSAVSDKDRSRINLQVREYLAGKRMTNQIGESQVDLYLLYYESRRGDK